MSAITSPRASGKAHPNAPRDWPGPEDLTEAPHKEWLQKVVTVVNGLMRGEHNAVGTFTLTASVTSSTLKDARIGTETVVHLHQTTANAATAKATTYQTYPNTIKGQAVFTHASNSQTDRTFAYSLGG